MEKLIYKGKIFSLWQVDTEINGQMHVRDIVRHGGGVAILAIQDHKIALVSQTRAAAGCKTLEIPAGTLEHGEDPAVCARRELNEETGLACQSMNLISKFWPTPGYCTEVLWIYQAENLYEPAERLSMDDSEDIDLVWMDLHEAWKKVQDHTIMDGKTIIAIQHALLQEKGI